MNLKELVIENGFSVLKSDYINIESKQIEFIHFKRVEMIEHQEMSEYFLVDIDSEAVNILFKNHNLNDFMSFQQKLISDTFFEYKNDIRWNIYLILLIREDELQTNVPIREIEKDTNFARKYIFNLKELEGFLNGTIFSNFENTDIETSGNINPETVWINELEKHNLSGCLTQNFQENNIDIYLETQKFNDFNLFITKENENVLSEETPTIEKITKLNLGQMGRPIFKGEKILEPAQVNLLHGANGTGKTTFLEAIELAITGENYRSKLFKESPNNEISITCSTSKGLRNFSSQKTPSESKRLENKWYGSPIGRGKSTLNQNFALFNYFDTDKSYRFALEEIEEEDDTNRYLNRFSQLIFGDHIIKMQKNWLRYKLGFETRRKKLLNNNKEISNQIADVSKKIENIKESNPINNEYLIDGYKKIFVKHQLREDTLSEEDIKYSIEILEYLEDPLQKISSEALVNSYNKLVPVELENDYTNLKSKVSVLDKNLIINAEKKENHEDKIKKLKENIQQKHVNITDSFNTLNNLQNSRAEFLKHKSVLSQSKLIKKRESLLIEIKEIESDLKLVNYVHKNWPEISEVIDISTFTSTINLDKLEDKISSIKQEVLKYDTKINDFKKYVGDIEELQIKIKNLGIEYLKKDPTETCPLCGTVHENDHELVEKITNKTYTSEEAFLLEISKIKSDRIQRLAVYEEQYQNEQKKLKLIHLILDCSNAILNSDQNNDLNIEQRYYKIIDFLNKKPNLLHRKKSLYSSLKFIEEDGINKETINNSKLFTTRDPFYKTFIEQKSIFDYEEFLVQLENEHNKIMIVNTEQLDVLSNALTQEESELLDLENNIAKINSERTIISKELKLINEVFHDIDQLSNYFHIDKNTDLYIWQKELKVFHGNLIKAMNYYNNSKQIEREKEDLKALEFKKSKNKEHLAICEDAINVLSNLSKHEEFVETFIKNNLSKIEYLFKVIHSPKEFTTLEFDKTGIIATRENNGVKAKAHQMSTGQRVSLALSVMFTHFLAASNAPNVLLLDEPVANMDDLHLLNLLDIIRELALRGTQIIFTTANPDVAGLFRRKFSFFGNDFKKFDFTRGKDGLTMIKEITYSPALEEEIVIKSV